MRYVFGPAPSRRFSRWGPWALIRSRSKRATGTACTVVSGRTVPLINAPELHPA
jgi:hypothetical protein